MTLKQLQQRLKPLNLKYVARETGISYSTIYNLANGGQRVSFPVVQQLIEWLEEQANESV